MGNPFVKIRGFPDCHSGTSQNGNSLFKGYIIGVKCCGPGGPLKRYF